MPCSSRILLAAACLLAASACAKPTADEGGATEGSTSDSESDTGALACEGAVPVIDHELWTFLDAADDPLADHRPDMVDCGNPGWYWYVEDGQLEIDTNFCNYLSLGQPSLAALEQGACLRLGLYYFDLVAPEPAQAHIALLVDGELVWEDHIEIPGPAQVYDLEFESPITAPAGSDVVFHLHNHGQNTWVFQYFEVAQ